MPVYDEIPAILARLRLPSVHGILFDLGVSSPQLDDPERGFAYSYDAPLDMRMDQTGPLTAADVVNTYPAARLARVLREYGEERFARRIADARRPGALPGPAHLHDAAGRDSSVTRSPRRPGGTGGNPAKRTFQALRIEVNGELEALRRALPAAMDAVAVGRPDRGARLPLARGPAGQAGVRGARDRHDAARPAGTAARQQAAVPAAHVGRGAPGGGRAGRNPRAASARLRAAERIRAAA